MHPYIKILIYFAKCQPFKIPSESGCKYGVEVKKPASTFEWRMMVP